MKYTPSDQNKHFLQFFCCLIMFYKFIIVSPNNQIYYVTVTVSMQTLSGSFLLHGKNKVYITGTVTAL
jgi:hypothetical protein